MKRSIANDYKITRDKFLTKNERDSLMIIAEAKAITDRQHGRVIMQTRWMLVHLAMNSGLRRAEIANLKIKDIHLNNGNEYIFVRQGKRGKDRDVYIDKGLAAHLKEYIRDKGDLFDQPNDLEDYLFTGQKGKYSTTALTMNFTAALRSAGLRKGLSIHSARHTYATLLYAKSKNLRFVQKQLGHASINMTSLYADIMPEQNSDIANSILDE